MDEVQGLVEEIEKNEEKNDIIIGENGEEIVPLFSLANLPRLGENSEGTGLIDTPADALTDIRKLAANLGLEEAPKVDIDIIGFSHLEPISGESPLPVFDEEEKVFSFWNRMWTFFRSLFG